jgi:membrane associated rhomboid family serine protease
MPTNSVAATPVAIAAGMLAAVFGFLTLVAGNWLARLLVVLAALVPLTVVLGVAVLWSLLPGPSSGKSSRRHWLIFFTPKMALALMAVTSLLRGRALS